jgi:hypothetical protein
VTAVSAGAVGIRARAAARPLTFHRKVIAKTPAILLVASVLESVVLF